MSGVRMCDECGTVFSDSADGISGGTEYDSDTGKQRTLDYCDRCTGKRKERRNRAFFRRPEEDDTPMVESASD